MTAPRPREVIAGDVDRCLAELGRLFAELECRVPTRERLLPRQFKVATLAAGGLTNPEIGRQLDMTEDQVKTALRGAFRVLGVRQRQRLAAAMAGRGGVA